jgi:CDK5RAP1-like protein
MIIPNIALTSDFICGFCDESEEAHLSSLDLINQVKYQFIYVFPYSMREVLPF